MQFQKELEILSLLISMAKVKELGNYLILIKIILYEYFRRFEYEKRIECLKGKEEEFGIKRNADDL